MNFHLHCQHTHCSYKNIRIRMCKYPCNILVLSLLYELGNIGQRLFFTLSLCIYLYLSLSIPLSLLHYAKNILHFHLLHSHLFNVIEHKLRANIHLDPNVNILYTRISFE